LALREDYTNGEVMVDNHPLAHNQANDVVNTLQSTVATIFNAVGDIAVATTAAQTDVDTTQFNLAIAGIGFVDHGTNANTARPTRGFARYIWFGTVFPNNWADGDIYVDLAP
jgi:hypothetical protein